MNEYIKREAVMKTLQKANIGGYITERLRTMSRMKS